MTTQSLPESLDEQSPFQQTADTFTVDTDEKAAWAMRKLARVKALLEVNSKMASDEVQRIYRWEFEVNAPLEKDAEYFIGILEHYGLTQRQESDRKTIKLPYGSISSKAGQDKWEFDPETFIPWARQSAPSLIRIKEEVNAADAKKVLSATGDGAILPQTGEIVPGLKITEGTIHFSITVEN